jgi:phosphate transport system substrate-binding protein
LGGPGNAGVAAAVKNTPSSIGYVELSYAIENKIAYSMMVNKAGITVQASAKTLQSAMSDFAGKFDSNLTVTLVDAPGRLSWPIAGYTYVIVHTKTMTDCNKAATMLGYFKWSLTSAAAASAATNLGYAVLPGEVRSQTLAKLAEVTCNGLRVLP